MRNSNYNRRNKPRGGCGGGRRNGHGGFNQNGRGNSKQFQDKGNSRKDEPKKELTLYYKECKEKKKFKIGLGGQDSEKIQLPSYSDTDQDETLLLLIKDSNLMIEDGDIFKEDEIGTEENDRPFVVANRRNRLIAIK